MAADDKGFSIEGFAVGGWKDEYYADRGPRLLFRLCNVPEFVEEVELKVYTSITEQDPGRSELTSSPLQVKQMLEGNSMKSWFNCFQVNTMPPIIFRAKTKSQVRDWINAIKLDSRPPSPDGSAVISGYCWLKPLDNKVWCSLTNDVLTIAGKPGGTIMQSWNLGHVAAPRAQPYTRRLTLSAANNWQSTAVYKLQVGFHGVQRFVTEVLTSRPHGVQAKTWRSPFFVVKSCNRHAAAKTASPSSDQASLLSGLNAKASAEATTARGNAPRSKKQQPFKRSVGKVEARGAPPTGMLSEQKIA